MSKILYSVYVAGTNKDECHLSAFSSLLEAVQFGTTFVRSFGTPTRIAPVYPVNPYIESLVDIT